MKGLYITNNLYWFGLLKSEHVLIPTGTVYILDGDVFGSVEGGAYRSGAKLNYFRTPKTYEDYEFSIEPIKAGEIESIKKYGNDKSRFREIDVDISLVTKVVTLLNEREALPRRLEESVRTLCRSVA